jgi:hypothetical protein
MKRNNSHRAHLIGGPALKSLTDLTDSKDPRAPFADVSNAAALLGDIDDDYGDADYGDSDYGDIQDTAALNTYQTLMGDADYGDVKTVLRKIGGVWKKIPVGVKIAGAAGALAYGGIKLSQAIRRKQQQNRANRAASLAASQNTIANSVAARQLLGKIPKTAQMPYYQIIGANLNSFPLSPTEFFMADTLKYNLDRQSTDTPFEVEIVNGVFAGVTWTLTATGTAANRFYVVIFITIGISVLTAAPGTIFNIAGILPTINGNLVISTNPFSYTIQNGYYAKKALFPWILVTNKPQLALGQYSNANPIVITVTGLPSNAAVNMIVPGSLHQWTIAMRNRLI